MGKVEQARQSEGTLQPKVSSTEAGQASRRAKRQLRAVVQDPSSLPLRRVAVMGMLGFHTVDGSHGNFDHPVPHRWLSPTHMRESQSVDKKLVGIPAPSGESQGWREKQHSAVLSRDQVVFPGSHIFLDQIQVLREKPGGITRVHCIVIYNEPLSFLTGSRYNGRHSELGARRLDSNPNVTTIERPCNLRCGPWFLHPHNGPIVPPSLKDSCEEIKTHCKAACRYKILF